jgi:hypothetical protein
MRSSLSDRAPPGVWWSRFRGLSGGSVAAGRGSTAKGAGSNFRRRWQLDAWDVPGCCRGRRGTSPTPILRQAWDVPGVAGLKTDGARYAALFASVGIARMRPSEAIGLQPTDFEFPSDGWGLAVLRGASTSAGTRFTSNGTVVEDKGLKQRPPDATRDVPSPRTWSSVRGGTWSGGRR